MIDKLNMWLVKLAVDAPRELPKIKFEDALPRIVSAILTFAGIIAVVMIIVGGYNYITAYGEPAKVTKAKHTITYAIVGLIIVLLAFPIFGFVISATGSK